jgi:hypothetical protein
MAGYINPTNTVYLQVSGKRNQTPKPVLTLNGIIIEEVTLLINILG